MLGFDLVQEDQLNKVLGSDSDHTSNGEANEATAHDPEKAEAPPAWDTNALKAPPGWNTSELKARRAWDRRMTASVSMGEDVDPTRPRDSFLSDHEKH